MRDRRPSTRLKNSVLLVATHSSDPQSYAEAMASDNAADWVAAIQTELAALSANGTWSLEQLPRGVKPIGTKYVFKTKRHADGSVERYKARLVAQGYTQRPGVDYDDDIYAPVSRGSTLRALLAKAAASDLELHCIDVKSAFLQGELTEQVWVQPPPGFPAKPGFACRLLRPLYGLKQAPRAWYSKLSSELGSLGFSASQADPALFLRRGSGSSSAGGSSAGSSASDYLTSWVDDLILAATVQRMASLKQQLLGKLDARDLGELSYSLGIRISRNRGSRSISLSPQHKVEELLSNYGMEGCKARAVPLSPGTRLTKDGGSPLDTSKYPFAALVGSLNYLACYTRPDIAFAVGILSRFLSCPTTEHWNAALGVLRYLAGTKGDSLTFSGEGSSQLTGYCDADFAADEDTRRSVTGLLYTQFGGALSWQSRRQQTVAHSTTEAEYMAAAACVREGLWLRTLAQELELDVGPNRTINIRCDNQAAIKLLHNPMAATRSKHIDVIHHFARERVQRGEVTFNYIETSQQLADSLTKALPVSKHNFCKKGMGVL